MMKTSWLQKLDALLIYLLAGAVILTVDIHLGKQISLWAVLLLPIGLATWNLGRAYGVVLAVAGVAALLVQALVWGSPFQELRFLLLAMVWQLLVMLAFVWLVDQLCGREMERARVLLKRP